MEQTNLYQLTTQLQAAFDRLVIDEETGEIANFEEVEQLDIAYDDKLEACAIVIKNKLAFVESLKQEKKVLDERIKDTEKSIESLKKRLTYSMYAVGKDKLETTKAKISFKGSTSVNVLDESKIPYGYMTEKVEYKPDKVKIKQALENGQVIAGAELVSKTNIQIK